VGRMHSTKINLLEEIKQTGLRPPRVVTLMITNGCNLQCRHCWPESSSRYISRPVSCDTLKRLIRELAHLQVEEVCLTGGEPLTHPDWLEILRYSCRRPGLKRVNLQTNGTLLDEAAINALRSIRFQGLLIQVSLEGADAQTHDRVRCPGSFERALKGLQRLAEAGMGKQTRVAFTEMQHNFADLPRLLKIVDRLGIGSLVSGTLVQQGRAAQSDQIAPPTPSQYRRLLDYYHSDPQFRSLYKRLGNIAALEWLAGRSNSSPQGCTCMETPYINAEGRIYPCLMLPAVEFAVEGAYRRPLAEILRQALSLWAGLIELNRRRSRELGPCKACPGRLHCAGGCMGRAYDATGDFMSVEDRCALRKAVYSWMPPSS
jgi:radical SAM protein with 4Fe4S-binding SPASM domain